MINVKSIKKAYAEEDFRKNSIYAVGGREVNRRGLLRRFRNGRDVGSYAGINFEIIGETESGTEKIFFETDIHYVDIGDGEPVLLVHGIGQSLYTWRQNIDALIRNGYRVIALDLAGFGYSGHPNIYYTAEEYAVVIRAFMDSINLKRAHIAAVSSGCMPAVIFAAANPKRTGKLILVSPGAPNENYPFGLKILSTGAGSAMMKVSFRESTLRSILREMYFDATIITPEVMENYYAPYRNKEVRKTLSQCMKHFNDEHARAVLKDIKSETLIFSGMEDKMHDGRMVRIYAGSIANSRHIRIRNCGQLVHEEKYHKFNEEFVKFLQIKEETEALSYSRRYQREQVD
jgi:pimeloyl-ACP methyl ester carboxylesterase